MVMYSALPFHTLFSHTHTHTRPGMCGERGDRRGGKGREAKEGEGGRREGVKITGEKKKEECHLWSCIVRYHSIHSSLTHTHTHTHARTHTQLFPSQACGHYVQSHSSKLKSKEKKSLPPLIYPGEESRRRTREEGIRWGRRGREWRREGGREGE